MTTSKGYISITLPHTSLFPFLPPTQEPSPNQGPDLTQTPPGPTPPTQLTHRRPSNHPPTKDPQVSHTPHVSLGAEDVDLSASARAVDLGWFDPGMVHERAGMRRVRPVLQADRRARAGKGPARLVPLLQARQGVRDLRGPAPGLRRLRLRLAAGRPAGRRPAASTAAAWCCTRGRAGGSSMSSSTRASRPRGDGRRSRRRCAAGPPPGRRTGWKC